jgi:thymidylate synthase (FAD)
MAHEVVPAAEEILDREFPVLDHGFVRLVDYLGGDQRIVQSARVSYGSGTKSYRQDKGLIDYLLRNEHTSPFEQVVLTFHTKMPVFVARQWVRHRTARLNEISGRYSVMKDEFYLPADDAIAPQAQDNKQGRSGEPFDEATRETIRIELAEQQGAAYRGYESLLERDLARELARINLPLSMYTEWYWQIDLHNLFHFLKLRMDGHAQYEIRAYAEVMFEIARAVCPLAVSSFEEHLRGSVRLSRSEFSALQRLLGLGTEASGSGSDAGADGTRAAREERIRAAAEQAGIEARAADRLVAKLLDGKMG